MYKVSKNAGIYSEEEINKIAQIAENVSKEELINIIYKLSELEGKMKWSSQKTIVFETEIIKLCLKEDTKALEDRVKKLEEIVFNGLKVAPTTVSYKAEVPEKKMQISVTNKSIQPKEEMKKTVEKKENAKQEFTPVANLANGNIISSWPNVLINLKKQGKVMLYANLINTEAVEINDMTVGIRFNNGLNSFRKELLQKPENMNVLTKEISIVCGKPMQIKLEDTGGVKQTVTKVNTAPAPKQSEAKQEEDILDTLDIPINFVEE